ncbi:MAG: chromate resistance protein ChrB domain-containing protein [Thermoplasmata archaeon]
MKWVTREKARVDRIACPWLIRKFIDPRAEFLYVPAEKVMEVAKREGAIPFDTPGAELHHYEDGGKEYVSFDAIIRKYKLTDLPLLELAKIVRVADGGSGREPEAAGLEAAATGFRMLAKDDLENQRLQFPLYDALYVYCKRKVEQGGTLEHTDGGSPSR